MNADSPKEFNVNKFAAITLVLAAITYVGFNLWLSYAQQRRQLDALAAKQKQNSRLVQTLVSSEELLLELTPRLGPLSRSVLNMRLPDGQARSAFAAQVRVLDPHRVFRHTLSQESARVGELKIVARDDLDLWTPLFDETAYFKHGKFYFIKGSFEPDNLNQFNSIVGFNGLAVHADRISDSMRTAHRQVSVRAEVEVGWTRAATTNNDADWQITSWKLNDVKKIESAGPLFRNVLKTVLPDSKALAQATVSRHTQLTSRLMQGKEYIFPPGEIYPFFFPDVTLEHPGVAVVDIDNDGFDDLYVAMQHDTNLLFRNKGDGSFEELSAAYGLNIAGGSTSATFADFDNDGDLDLFLGRARRPSLYLVNENGKFIDRTLALIGSPLPALVSSMSAADYNNDGLLDIYICTYSPIEESNRFQVTNKPLWIDLFLNPRQAEEVTRRNRRSHRFMDRAGPPNLLLKNLGNGKFGPAKENTQLELWRMTFQASWNDYDGDGDQDIYVANDYAPDNFLRNDGADGFTDITAESGLTGMGFGMGVSWGDYDNDGQVDVYVSNMFSKAGKRITDQVTGIDPQIREMAQGNFLYRLNKGKFSLMSEQSDCHVAKAGWSWGGQFFDFNNDGFRDIYATSGYYTAPADIAIDIDL